MTRDLLFALYGAGLQADIFTVGAQPTAAVRLRRMCGLSRLTLWASRRDHLDRRQLHIVRRLRYLLIGLGVLDGYGCARYLDLVTNVRCEVRFRRAHADRLQPSAFHIGNHISADLGALLQTSRH